MIQRYRFPAMTVGLASALVSLALSNCASPGGESPESQGAFGSVSSFGPGSVDASVPMRGEEASAPGAGPSLFARDPIAAVGHGAAITADGDVITEPSSQFIREAQAYYIDRLLREASPDVRKEFRSRERDVGASEIATNAADFDWLLDRVKPEDGAVLRSIHRFLAVKGGAEEVVYGAQFEAFLVEPDEDGEDAYVAKCREAGVPIPPNWGTAEWRHRGPLDTVLVSPGYQANVYVYESTDPLGVCMALPRSNASGIIELFGVICQGNVSNKACFWDNTNRRLEPEKVSSLTGGPDFAAAPEIVGGDVCTDCHRGENVFIVHPGTPLDLTVKTAVDPRPRKGLPNQIPSGWVDPLVADTWPKNPIPQPFLESVEIDWEGDETNAPDGSCLDCHNELMHTRLGELSGGYCRTVVVPALRRGFMPPQSYIDSFDRKPSFQKHTAAIEAVCAEALSVWTPAAPALDEWLK